MDKVVVVGSSNMDIVVSVPHIPVVGETILAKDVNFFYGGKGANQAAAIARLGGNVSMIGCVGNDDYGLKIINHLGEIGTDVSGIEKNKNFLTGNAYIYVSDEGENNIVVNPGANNNVTPELIEKNIKILEDAKYCIVQLEIPLESLYYLANLCKEKGIKLILNPAPATELDFTKLGGTFMIAPNETEIEILVRSGETVEDKAKILYEYGFQNVIVTLGENGCMLVNENGITYFEAYKKLAVSDTTAAGDSFIGSLVFELSQNKTLEEAIVFSSIAAAITVSRNGAQVSLPDYEEVRSLIDKG